jgi:hypothetical protein
MLSKVISKSRFNKLGTYFYETKKNTTQRN